MPKVEKPPCDLCQGRLWFRTRSGWPTECHRCLPEVKKAKNHPPRLPLPVATKLTEKE